MSVSEMRWSKERREVEGDGGREESTEGVNKRRGGHEERAGKGNEKKRYISK